MKRFTEMGAENKDEYLTEESRKMHEHNNLKNCPRNKHKLSWGNAWLYFVWYIVQENKYITHYVACEKSLKNNDTMFSCLFHKKVKKMRQYYKSNYLFDTASCQERDPRQEKPNSPNNKEGHTEEGSVNKLAVAVTEILKSGNYDLLNGSKVVIFENKPEHTTLITLPAFGETEAVKQCMTGMNVSNHKPDLDLKDTGKCGTILYKTDEKIGSRNYDNDGQIIQQLLTHEHLHIKTHIVEVYMIDDKGHPQVINGIPWNSLNEERWRLHTYSQYPFVAKKSAILLAEAGFAYYGSGKGSDDNVICYFCCATKQDWKESDVIDEIHRRLSPECCMVTQVSSKNVPMIMPSNGETLFNHLLNQSETNRYVDNRQSTRLKGNTNEIECDNAHLSDSAEDRPTLTVSPMGSNKHAVSTPFSQSIFIANQVVGASMVGHNKTPSGSSASSSSVASTSSDAVANRAQTTANLPGSRNNSSHASSTTAVATSGTAVQNSTSDGQRMKEQSATSSVAVASTSVNQISQHSTSGLTVPSVPTTTQSSTNVFTTTQSSTNVSTATQSSTNVFTTTQSRTNVSTTTQSSTNVSTATQSSTNVPTTTQSSTNVPNATQSSTNVPTATQSITNVPTTGQSSTNVSTTTQSSTNVPTTTQSSTNVPTASQSISQPQGNSQTASTQNTSTATGKGPTYGELGIITERPKRFEYAVRATRFLTFEQWPRDHHLKKEDLADAGFYYAGYGDCARCFYCGGGLRNWENDDNVWVEHARWFPKCAFIRQTMGQQFVDAVQDLNRDHERISYKMVTDKMGSSAASFQLDTKSMPLKRDPAVLTVLDMGYNIMDVVEAANLVKEKYGVLSADKVFEKLEQDGKLRTNKNISSNNQANSHTSGASSNESATNKLKEQNNQLRQQTVCKICMDKEVAVVFLPCGHFVSCTDCAAAMKHCPVCRKEVRGIVRAFIG